MHPSPRSSFALVTLVAAALLLALVTAFVPTIANAQPATAVADESHAARGENHSRCAYGVTLAMSGELRQAESVFVAILSDSPGDARALTNLGNLRVLEGDFDVALVFYNQAARAAADDPGVKLNRATTLMLMGDQERAELEAAEAVTQAGGVEAAAKLLGLQSADGAQPSRSSDKPFVSQQEIRALLTAAKERVPGDSLGTDAPADSTRVRPKMKKTTWRTAGPRAGDTGDIASVLYWKQR
jgi:Flp pilus assembly protein TadD